MVSTLLLVYDMLVGGILLFGVEPTLHFSYAFSCSLLHEPQAFIKFNINQLLPGPQIKLIKVESMRTLMCINIDQFLMEFDQS